MAVYKFIRTKGAEAKYIGYYAPRVYRLDFSLKMLKQEQGFQYLRDRMSGWYIWYVENRDDLAQAIAALNELKKTRAFTYEISE